MELDLKFLKEKAKYLRSGNFLQDQDSLFIDSGCVFIANETPKEIAEVFVDSHKEDPSSVLELIMENLENLDIQASEDMRDVETLDGVHGYNYDEVMEDESDYLGWALADNNGGVLCEENVKYDFILSGVIDLF